MKRALLLLAVASCANPNDREYTYNDLRLVSAYTALNACSCLFVEGMSEEYCRAWVKQTPALARFSINHDRQSVTSGTMLLWGSTARYIDDSVGCQPDD